MTEGTCSTLCVCTRCIVLCADIVPDIIPQPIVCIASGMRDRARPPALAQSYHITGLCSTRHSKRPHHLLTSAIHLPVLPSSYVCKPNLLFRLDARRLTSLLPWPASGVPVRGRPRAGKEGGGPGGAGRRRPCPLAAWRAVHFRPVPALAAQSRQPGWFIAAGPTA